MFPYQARAFFVVVSGADPSLCSFVGIPCRPSHGSHLLSFCSALLYHIHEQARLLFHALGPRGKSRGERRERAASFSLLLSALHLRGRDLRVVPTEAEGRTRPGQASIEKP